jgi:FlaA1/EpsC-like NDP-sugar epimerase
LEDAAPGEVYVPKVPSARIVDVAKALIGSRPVETVFTGIRPGEKVHEILVSEEEAWHSYPRRDYYVIKPMLPELWQSISKETPLTKEYSSRDNVLNLEQISELLRFHNLDIDSELKYDGEFLR